MELDRRSIQWCTVVDPSEYDIEDDMKEMVKLANERKTLYILLDVGKILGLYLAYKELKEDIKDRLTEEKNKGI